MACMERSISFRSRAIAIAPRTKEDLVNWRMSVAWLALTAAACAKAPAPGPAADLVIVNGRVFTADERGTTAEACAMAGNKILPVGSTGAVSALRGPQTRVVDAHGGTVAPGFNDSHVHFISGGMTLGDVDLAGLTTLAAVQDAIRAFAAAHAGAAWVEGRGWLYSPFPGGTPTRKKNRGGRARPPPPRPPSAQLHPHRTNHEDTH